MKALTIWQPWATLIAIGAKQYETRGYSTSYRGPIAIHAGAKWNRELIGGQMQAVHILRAKWGVDDPRVLAFEEKPPLGAIIAVAYLDGCRICTRSRILAGSEMNTDRLSKQERAFGNFTGGRYAWRLENIGRLSEPYEIKGRQGLWDLPPDAVRELDRRMTPLP